MSLETKATLKRKADVMDHCFPKKTFALCPYLFFDGNAREAITFYKEVFGAEIEMIETFEKCPIPVDDSWKDKVLHASLKIQGFDIMISDGKCQGDVKMGDNVHLSVWMDDEDKLRSTFDAISGSGGKVTVPLEKPFWGSLFGSAVDQFGIHWMFSGNNAPDDAHESEKAKAEEATKT
eukprot:gene29592-38162_t